jgi:NTE family protein
LFQRKTFAEMRHAYVVLNATDMASGEVFAFTPQRFDDICSDLSRLPVSVGVTSSAAFPVLLSPMNLDNYSYSGCPGSPHTASWIKVALNSPNSKYINLEEAKRARYANALRKDYAGPPYRDENYLHLLDGGLADNQGIHSLTEAIMSPHSGTGLLYAINSGQVTKIVVISVNARSDPPNDVGKDKSIPGLIKVVNTVIGTPIDATTAAANSSMQELISTLKGAGEDAAKAQGSAKFAGMTVYGVSIDFDQFLPTQADLQARVKGIGTSWTLKPEQLQDTLEAGHLLLRQHPCYQQLLLDMKASDHGTPKLGHNNPPQDVVCP